MRICEYARHAVTVTEPTIVNAYMKEKEYLCSIDMDKLMAGFREAAGLPRRADKYPGGWENEEYAGHTLGHYMVALAQVYAKEKSGEIKERLEYILSELSESQKQNGYLFTSDMEVFEKLESGQPYKSWYTMHKIVTGLITVYKLTGMEEAFTIVKKLGEWIAERVLNWSSKQKRWTLSVADGGMNDCLYELYNITGDERYAEAAERFDEADLFTPLSMGKDVLANKHAAETIPKILGALNRYMALGESEVHFLETAQKFFDMVVEGHTYVTGGNGELMHFRTPGALAADRTQYNSETCSTYGMMKLAERLYSITGDKKYMDYYEQAYFNAMLGAQNPEDGMTAFFQPMATGYFKTFSTPFSKFWCCTGTGMEIFTDLNSNIYHAGEDGVYVNLYLSSVLEDGESGVKLTQTVDMESFESAEFALELKGRSSETAVYFRQPEWGGEVTVTVNGAEVNASVKNGYIDVGSPCKDGDRIVLKFSPVITLHPLPDMEYCAAVTYGPLVLAAGLGQEDMTTERMRRTNVTVPTKNVKVRQRMVLQEGRKRSEWLANCKENFVKKDGELAFTVSGTDADDELVFSPYYKIYNERYGIYFEFYDDENLPDDLRAILEEQKRLEEERLAAEAEAARKAEEERRRQEEEEQKRKDAERQRREAERLRQEEEERQRQEELRKKREEDYRLRRGIELQRQELQRRLEAEAEERERREDEERKQRAQEERKRREEEARQKAEEEARQQAEEEARQKAEAEKAEETPAEPLESNMARRLRMEEEARRRREEAAAAEEKRQEEARQRQEEERQRQEEERKRREEDYRLRRGIDLQRQEMESRRQEGDDDRARRESREAEQKRQDAERARREEEYRLLRERELQRQEMERRRQEEEERKRINAEEEEKRRIEEERQRAEEEKKRAEEEKQRAEEEKQRAEEERLADAQRAAQLAEARLREEEAKLLLAKLAAERAQIEATMILAEPEDKRKSKLKNLFGGKKK